MTLQHVATTTSSASGNRSWVGELDFLWLEVTTKCNLQCVHCYAESGPQLPLIQGMTYDRWVSVLKDGFALGCRKVQFIGGEPTLYPPLMDLVKDAQHMGYEFIEVFTNGTYLKDEMLELFRDCNVHLAFSAYSSEADVHDRITMRQGSHARTIENIRKAIDYGIPVRAGIIEMPENSEGLEATKALLREIGVQSIGTDRLRGIGRGNVTLQATDPMRELCGACWRGQLAIDSQGDVFPCIFSRFHKVGNVVHGLRYALENDELHKFRRDVRDMDEIQAKCGPDDCNPYCKPNCHPYEKCNPCNPKSAFCNPLY